MKRIARTLLAAVLAALAGPIAAQKDVGDPLEHFLATKGVDGAQRSLEYPVLRVAEDLNNDGMIDVGLWQPRDFAARTGPLFLYMQRKDGRFAAAGSVVAEVETLVRVIPGGNGSARLLACGGPAPAGYEVVGFIVTELPRERLPDACAGATREAPMIERLDADRYRRNGVQAWIRR